MDSATNWRTCFACAATEMTDAENTLTIFCAAFHMGRFFASFGWLTFAKQLICREMSYRCANKSSAITKMGATHGILKWLKCSILQYRLKEIGCCGIGNKLKLLA